MTDLEKIKARLLSKQKKELPPKPSDYLSTGCTVLNLALSGHPDGGIRRGTFLSLPGDSNSGKTWLAYTVMAEATINPNFKKYSFYFDNPENGSWMDVRQYFGTKLASSLKKLPNGHSRSASVEGFWDNVEKALDKGPCIYVLDSMDALKTRAELKAAKEPPKKNKEGKEVGSYGTGKAKTNSGRIGPIINKLEDNGSILIIISQTRDNIGAGMFGPKKTRSGGNALTFFAHLNLWLSIREKVTNPYKGVKVPIGIRVRAELKRSRLTGKERTVYFPILADHGIDDLGAMVDFLVQWKHWTQEKEGGKVRASEFEKEPKSREWLIKIIQKEESQERKLKDLVVKVWEEIDRAVAVERKSRYA